MRVSSFVRATTALVFGAATVQAQAPVGTFNFGGSVGAPGGFTSVFVHFLGGPLNNIVALPGSTGSFASFNPTPFPPVASQYYGTIQDISALSGPQPLPGFLLLPTFHLAFPGVSGPTAPSFSFNLASIAPGAYGSAACAAPPAIGQTCSPPASGVNLSNIASSSGTFPISATASLSLSGTVVNLGGTGGSSPFFGSLTAQFPGQSYQSLIASVASGNAPPDVSFSGTLVAVTSTVPEPATNELLIMGVLALGAAVRWRRTQA